MRPRTPTLGRIAIVAAVIVGVGWMASYFMKAPRPDGAMASYQPADGRMPQSIEDGQTVHPLRNRIADYLREKDLSGDCSINGSRDEVKNITCGTLARDIRTTEKASVVARDLLRVYEADNNDADQTDLIAKKADESEGMTHFIFQQTYRGASIVDGGMILQAKDGNVIAVDASIKRIRAFDERKVIDESRVMTIAQTYLHDKQAKVKVDNLSVFVLKNGHAVWAWHATAETARVNVREPKFYISAADGSILKYENGAFAN